MSQQGSGFGPLPPLPPPPSFNPASYASNVPRAQSVPLSNPMPGPTSDIPPPHMVAPSVFYQPVSRPGGGTSQYNNQQYNNQQYNNQQWMTPQYPYQPPKAPPAPPPPQATPPQPAPTPPEPPKPEPPQPEPKAPTAQLDSGLDDATIKQLNERLNSENDGTRADAAMDIYKILEKSPDLQANPVYKPYIDAFMEKILADPSAIVRQAGLLTLEMGHVKAPSQRAQDLLNALSQKGGLYDIESGAAKNILADIQSGKFSGQTPGQKLNVVSSAQESVPQIPSSQLSKQEGAFAQMQSGVPVTSQPGKPQAAQTRTGGTQQSNPQAAQAKAAMSQQVGTQRTGQAGGIPGSGPAGRMTTAHTMGVSGQGNMGSQPLQGRQPGSRLNIQEGR